MPKSNDEIRKSIKKYEQSLPDSELNPNAKEDIESFIARASQPTVTKPEKLPRSDGYNGKQTRLRKTEDTSD